MDMSRTSTDGDSDPSPRRPGRWIVPLVLWSPLIVSAGFLARNGRLIGDDYCNAAAVIQRGVVGATVHLFQTWHGGWAANLAVSGFGWTVLHLPAGVGYVPFVAGTLALLVAVGRGVAITLFPGMGWARWSAVVPGVVTLQLVGLLALGEQQELLFAGLLWQAASLVHLWPTLLTIVLLLAVVELRNHPSHWVTGALILCGALVGGFNFTETAIMAAAAAILAVGCLAAARSGGEALRRTGWRSAGLAVMAGVAFAVMYEAPGTRARQELLAPPPPGTRTKLVLLLDHAQQLLALSLGRTGVLAAVALGVAATVLVRSRARRRMVARRAVALACISAAVGLAGTLLAAGGELASYPAQWHALALIPWWLLAALGAGLCMGVGGIEAGVALRPWAGRLVTGAAVAVPVLASALLIALVALWARPLEARSATWDTGAAAPMASIGDREVPYVRACWTQITDWGYEDGTGLSPRVRPKKASGSRM